MVLILGIGSPVLVLRDDVGNLYAKLLQEIPQFHNIWTVLPFVLQHQGVKGNCVVEGSMLHLNIDKETRCRSTNTDKQTPYGSESSSEIS